jgi:putative aldouronate transport system substrate-binding protein
MKKILALVLALALIATLGITSAFAADEGFVDGKFTETRHITVEVFQRPNDGNSDPTNNPYANYIKEQMLEKYNVEVEFVPVGRWTEVDDLNNLLATGKAPDISYTYSAPTINTYAAMEVNGQPGVIDLAPYLDEYKALLPNLAQRLGGEEYLYYDKDPVKGTVWMLQGALAENARINTFIRKDWLDKLNLPLPTTEEEFYNALVAFRDNAETLLGADAAEMIPYTTSTDVGWRNDLLSISKVAEDISDEALFVYGYDDRHILYPGYKEGIRVLNKWYNEGLIWKDFAQYNDSTEEDNKMKSGFFGAFMHNWDYPFRGEADSIESNLARNVGEGAAFVSVDCFKNDAGITRKFLAPLVGGDRKIFFPSTNKEPLASLLYLDFISAEDTIYFLQTGKEGETFSKDENGVVTLINATGEWIRNSPNNIDYTMTNNGLILGDVSTYASYPGTDPAIVEAALKDAKENSRIAKHFNVGSIESEQDVGSSLNEKRNAFLTQAIVAPVEEFDKVFDEGMDDYMISGGQDIIDERIEKLQSVYGITFEK